MNETPETPKSFHGTVPVTLPAETSAGGRKPVANTRSRRPCRSSRTWISAAWSRFVGTELPTVPPIRTRRAFRFSPARRASASAE
mgnify:CR=1 FL=1